ncbi:MAG: hypothetical protein AAF492_16390 [Verrucomicrobiota bacterium]
MAEVSIDPSEPVTEPVSNIDELICPHPQCKCLLPESLAPEGLWSTCASCPASLRVHRFPALYRPPEKGRAGELIVDPEQAGCFFHEDRKAEVACDACGRFLCSLCDITFAGRHLCSTCISQGRKDKAPTLRNSATMYDSLALGLALVPFTIIGVYVSLFTAIASLIMARKHWNTPCSVLPRSKARFMIAALLSLVQIALWIFGIAYLIAT